MSTDHVYPPRPFSSINTKIGYRDPDAMQEHRTGVDNIADGLTKILSRPAFQEWEQKVMQRIFEPSIGK